MTYVGNTRWTMEMTKKLVDEYGKHECLWNFNIPDYRNRVMRDNAYEILRADLGINGLTIKELKWKIKNVRSTYSSQLKKMYESHKNSPDDPYIPRVAWFKTVDSYLRQHITQYYTRRTRSPELKRPAPEPDCADRTGLKMVCLDSTLSAPLNGVDLLLPQKTEPLDLEGEYDETADSGAEREVVDETSSAGEGPIPSPAERHRCGEKSRMLSAWKSVAPHVEPHRPEMVMRGMGTAEEWMDSEFAEHCPGDISGASHIASSGEVLNSGPRMRRRRTAERPTQQRSPHQSSVDHAYTSPPTSAAAPSANREEQRGTSATPAATASLASRASPPALESASSTTASGPDDEFDAFGRSAAAQLRRMPLRMALRAQLQIQSFLTEARLYACSGYEDFPEDN